MNKTLIKIAEQYEKTAEMLLDKARLLRDGIDPNKCEYRTETGKLVKGCKTCGTKTWIKCALKPHGYVNSGLCGPQCENFKPKGD